jgi:signal transduction histidine kinase
VSRTSNRNGGFSASELRAVERSVFRSRRTPWLGVAAVLVPLAMLLGLQYWWLGELERNSAIARQAALANYVEAVVKEVDYFYWKTAERALNLPAVVFSEETIYKAGHFFKKKEVEGAKRLFIVSFLAADAVWFYDPVNREMVIPEYSGETVAVWAAMSPWKIFHKKGVKLETASLSVDQHDPTNRIVINPILDDESKLVGLAGLIVDDRFFETVLLPEAIDKALPEPGAADGLIACVRDGQGRQVLPAGAACNPADDRARRHPSFVFTDWKISVQGSVASPEHWARANFVYNMTLSAVLAAAVLIGIVLTLRTALRESKLSAMKNEFVSNVSHELRTPLASIRVFGELMRRGKVTDRDKVREYGAYIESESRRLTQLINNILDFSRIESGAKVYQMEPASIEGVIAGALSSFDVRLRNSGISLSYQGPEGELPDMPMDASAIDRAVANLVDNAIKYSNGGEQIEVRLSADNGEVAIAVTDHGIGIPKDEQERIFERFHRVSTGLVHDVRGSGLGLSLVHHIVDAHGGRVTVDSRPGEGSTFTIHLPMGGAAGEGA